MSLWICPTHGLYGPDLHCPHCGGIGTLAQQLEPQHVVEPTTDEMPWWEKALRDFADEHGPSGDTWNISYLLDHFRKVRKEN